MQSIRSRRSGTVSIGRRIFLTTASLFAAPSIVRAQAPAGVALVIGNSKYKWESSLPNVRRDVSDVARAFQALGLKTELLQDVGQDAMRAAVDKFGAAARGANLAAFYYAGHGASWEKDSYLVGEDADLANPATVRSLLSVADVRKAMKEAKHRLLVFDSCRNNPADGWRQKEAVDAARINATEKATVLLKEPNTLVLHSTASGRIALDGPAGENSPFAAAFLRQLDGPPVDLQALPVKLRRDLLIATEGRQLVWDYNTYFAPFVLNRDGKPAPRGAMPARDLSKIIELPNAFAYAKEAKLVLPQGIIAYRGPHGSPHASKIGAFKYAAKTWVTLNDTSIEPALVAVLTVVGDTAEMIYASREFGTEGDGAFWQFVNAQITGDRLIWRRRTAFTSSSFELTWKDPNSGELFANHLGRSGRVLDYKRFSRLDG